LFVPPAPGDSGCALGAALYADRIHFGRPDLDFPDHPFWGPAVDSAALARIAREDDLQFEEVEEARLIEESAADLEMGRIVAWMDGRCELGPRALGHRSLLANPRHADTLRRLNDVKGREQFRPVAPMTLADRAAEMFDGPLPSPYMLFVHTVKRGWEDKLGAVVHVDGTARVQTVDRAEEPLVAAMLDAVERRTGIPVVVNTSLNTAGRPMVDSPRDALECFGSAPVDALAIGPFLLERAVYARRAADAPAVA
jgi:carbamoyltransferase